MMTAEHRARLADHDEYRYADATALAAAVALRLEQQLAAAITRRGAASLVVCGGRTPGPIFERLASAALDWGRVWITLSDERWVPPDHEDSNEALVRARLLRGPAARARWIGHYQPGATPRAATAILESRLIAMPRPFDAVLLGMGEDGHIASLFADAQPADLDPQSASVCVAVERPSQGQARVSLTLATLIDTSTVLLVFHGTAKHAVLRSALSSPQSRYPVAALLRQARAPIAIHWSP